MNDDVWANEAIAAMLERIRRVIIWELEQRVKEMRRG